MDHDKNDNFLDRSDRDVPALAVIVPRILCRQNRPVENPAGKVEPDAVLVPVEPILVGVPLEENCNSIL